MSWLEHLYRLDVLVLRLINSAGHTPWLDALMSRVSDWSSARWPVLVTVLLAIILGRLKERMFVLLTALLLLFGDVVICQYLKDTTNRSRPYQVLDNVRIVSVDGVKMSPRFREHHISMPSSHAFNNAVFGLTLVMFYRRWSHLAWIWVVMMGYSRVYTGNHYPSDVLVGIGLGLGYTWLGVLLFRGLWRWVGARYWPVLYQRYPQLFPPLSPAREGA